VAQDNPADPFRAVAPFLGDVLQARALASALQMGLIDLLSRGAASRQAIAERYDLAPGGEELFGHLLESAGVFARNAETIALTPQFRDALIYRDLIDTKLQFAEIVLPDFLNLFLPFIQKGSGFMPNAQVFELFRYDRARERSPENRAATERWVALTTGLTKYEGPGLLALFDFARVRRLLDVGGNSGEMAAQICAGHPHIEAVVFDLPVVCDVGRAHLAARREGRRVHFVEGDARRDSLPENMDAVLFKSILHDWPQDDALRLLNAGAQALSPGGLMIVFERLPLDLSAWERIPYGQFHNLVFLHFLRGPDFYAAALQRLGFAVSLAREIVLDVPFFVLVARKP